MKRGITKKENSVSKPIEKQISTLISFPIVGIGASAGGLEALEQFFQNVPKKLRYSIRGNSTSGSKLRWNYARTFATNNSIKSDSGDGPFEDNSRSCICNPSK